MHYHCGFSITTCILSYLLGKLYNVAPTRHVGLLSSNLYILFIADYRYQPLWEWWHCSKKQKANTPTLHHTLWVHMDTYLCIFSILHIIGSKFRGSINRVLDPLDACHITLYITHVYMLAMQYCATAHTIIYICGCCLLI